MFNTMTRDDIQRAMLAFEQSGGVVKHCVQGDRALQWAIDPALVDCTCGCRGNYTDHTMREGESGRYNY